MSKISKVYLSRVENGDKCFGFGITPENEGVYIPGDVINEYDLQPEDRGTANVMTLTEDRSGKADFVATAIVVEDTAMRQANIWMKEEIERLENLLKENGIDYEL